MFLIRIILFFIIISFIVRIIGRIIIYFSGNNRSFNRNQNQESDGRKEGDVSVQSKNSNRKKINKDIGEYVSYEEIDN